MLLLLLLPCPQLCTVLYKGLGPKQSPVLVFHCAAAAGRRLQTVSWMRDVMSESLCEFIHRQRGSFNFSLLE